MTRHFTKQLPIGSPEWREQVKHRLLDGYGSEDIALWLRCHVSHVQGEIAQLRKLGFLARWWKK